MVRSRNDILAVTLRVLLDEGWDAVTHAHIADVARYSKGTVYKHWPTRADLVRDAFARLGDMPHHHPTGDVRADLIAEISTFRTGMHEQRLDRALLALVQLGDQAPDLVDVKQRLVTDGERVVRQLLAPMLEGAQLEAATLMLVGAVLHGAVLHGLPPTDKVIAASVDLVLTAAGHGEPRT